jgi:hypothetical protein
MDAKVWEIITAGDEEEWHAFPDGFNTLCSPDLLSQGAERFTVDAVFASETGAEMCPSCYSESRKSTTKTETKGKTMAAKSSAKNDSATAEVKYDVNTDEGKAALETIAANTERVASLRAEGNTDGAEALSVETDTMITALAGKNSIKAKKDARDALRKANEVEAPKSAEVAIPSDYREIEGVSALVDEGAKKIREGIAVGLKMVDLARSVGEIQLAQRLRITDPKTGLPDLNAVTRPAKDASKDTYGIVAAELAPDDVESQAMHASIMKATQNRRSDVLVKFLRDLETVQTPEEIRSVFPTIQVADEKGAEESYTEAVYALYAEKGIELPRKGRTELAAEAAREKAAKAKLALEAAKSEDDSEGGEGDSGEGAGDAEPEEITDPVEYAGAYVAKLKRANKGARPGIFAELDSETAEKVKADLEAQMRVLKDILAELV